MDMKDSLKSATSPADGQATRLKFHVGSSAWIVTTQPGRVADVITCVPDDRCTEEEYQDLAITVAPDTMRRLLDGSISPFSAMLQRKLFISGNQSVLTSSTVSWLWQLWQLKPAHPVAQRRYRWLADAMRWVSHVLYRTWRWAALAPKATVHQ